MIGLTVMGLSVISSSAGWVQNNGKWYYTENGQNVTNNWLRMTENGEYIYYYMGSDGAMTTGWKQIDNSWYYFRSDGIMQKGWVKVGDYWYYLNLNDGKMVIGWLKLDNNGTSNYYYLKSSGAMTTGWRQIENAWYYFLDDGSCVIGKWARINNKWYCFGSDGKMVTGWHQQNGTYYYLNSDGSMYYSVGLLSSYLGIGTWELDGDTVTLTTDDGNFVHHFAVEDGALVYQAKDSTDFMYLTVSDGEKFLPSGASIGSLVTDEG